MPDSDANNLRNILASHIGDLDNTATRQRIQEEIDSYIRNHPRATMPAEIVSNLIGISRLVSDIDISSFYPNSILLDSVNGIADNRTDRNWGTISHPSAFSARWQADEPFEIDDVLKKYKNIQDRFDITRSEIPEYCISNRNLLENWLKSLLSKEIEQISHGFGCEATFVGVNFSMPNGITARLNTVSYNSKITVEIEAYPFMFKDNYDFDKILNPVAILIGTVEEFKKVYNRHSNL